MKTTIATLAAGLLVLGGIAWAQMEPGKHSGSMLPPSATASSKAETTPETTKRPMMGNMMGNMMKSMMGGETQDDIPLIQRLLQQREQLDLAPDQVQQLQDLARDTHKALIRQGAELQVTELDLEALMRADPIDFARVEEAVKRQESQRAEMRLARLDAIAKAKALLTPEQRQHVSMQMASTAPDMPGMMGCPMMSGMMGRQSDT